MKKRFNIRKLVFLGLVLYLSYFFIAQAVTMNRVSKDINNEKLTVQKLQQENDKLQDEVQLSKTDKYKEILARERLGLVKEGETPVINSQKK